MDSSARKLYDEEYLMATQDDKYYMVAGIQFEKDRKYTVKDYYELIPEGSWVELIDGVFYEMYPETDEYRGFPSTRHQEILGNLYFDIRSYINSNNGPCKVYVAGLGVLSESADDISYVQPDITVVCDPDKLTKAGCEGAPDWVIEIVSPSNPKNDYVRKLNLYDEMGVREYWIVDPDKERVFVYDFSNTNVNPTVYTFQDTIKAGIYEHLYIDFTKM